MKQLQNVLNQAKQLLNLVLTSLNNLANRIAKKSRLFFGIESEEQQVREVRFVSPVAEFLYEEKSKLAKLKKKVVKKAKSKPKKRK